MSSKYMRLLVMFDLPVVKAKERRAAAKFRQYLLGDGYVMMQYSVYYRIVNGYDMAKKYELRLDDNLPEKGSVRLLVVTEKQFDEMRLLVGDPLPNEEKLDSGQMTTF
ncbi:CRISPR-associated endonuclease Cas2 [Loigolactobacillus coryniformis]|uniref:CRISPR-associated endoribonuclease Cas2 n=2 Tax=Loigolactobacillus coryniformis TaxID=1610 RepID=A0A2D1KK87_9LACO|nr:CRISPR-associated endonuclease Cas2 [Loigolactobacillus coryniformis]ATO42540.1 CRISPR-associated endonuclease Cas2 [Loigolactobacillus coryniformis subsp. torquens DSM 20004 = KCTC 3535]QEA52494.1 CRISPR-associated endonuclease Cas2 [Loigolactobacillus coryniformis]